MKHFLFAVWMFAGGAGTANASWLTLDSLSNSSNTGTVSFSNGTTGTTGSFYVYISQFQMFSSSSSTQSGQPNLYTYCVDLFHDEHFNTPYSVTQTNLTGSSSALYGQTTPANLNEMAYLYHTYGTSNLSGHATLDAALQLALWDLSLNHTIDPFQPFSTSGSVYFNYIGPTQAVTNQVTAEVTNFLADAVGKSASSVSLLQNMNPNDPADEQNVLYDNNPHNFNGGPPSAPEPSTFVLCSFAGLISLGYVQMRRRRLAIA